MYEYCPCLCSTIVAFLCFLNQTAGAQYGTTTTTVVEGKQCSTTINSFFPSQQYCDVSIFINVCCTYRGASNLPPWPRRMASFDFCIFCPAGCRLRISCPTKLPPHLRQLRHEHICPHSSRHSIAFRASVSITLP